MNLPKFKDFLLGAYNPSDWLYGPSVVWIIIRMLATYLPIMLKKKVLQIIQYAILYCLSVLLLEKNVPDRKKFENGKFICKY